jgi:hypothetical protein
MTSTWNDGRGFSAFISRRNPGRFVNSAPLMPSSTNTDASSTHQPFAIAYARASESSDAEASRDSSQIRIKK